MPHLTLEHSSNLVEKENLTTLFKQCHTLLAQMLPTQEKSCISRAISHEQYYIGEGQSNKAFIHVIVKVKAGRTVETLNKTGESLLKAINDYCVESSKQLDLKISLEIIELQSTYFSC